MYRGSVSFCVTELDIMIENTNVDTTLVFYGILNDCSELGTFFVIVGNVFDNGAVVEVPVGISDVIVEGLSS